MRPIVFLAFLGYACFSGAQSQSGKLRLLVQAGNTYFLNPYYETQALAPACDVLLVASAHENPASVRAYYVGGLSYASGRQILNVLWSGSNNPQYTPCSFKTNEYLFNLGAAFHLLPDSKLSVTATLLLQGGQNYTSTNDVGGQITMSRVVHTSSGWQGFLQPPGAHYATKSRAVSYRWSYLQFYAAPGISMLCRMNKRMHMCFGAQARVFLGREYVGTDAQTVVFNYAPVKLFYQAGLLLNILNGS